jgi:large exoprotein involved in heme utilization and adhesion
MTNSGVRVAVTTANVESLRLPLLEGADLAKGLVENGTLVCRKNHGLAGEAVFLFLSALGVGREDGSSERVAAIVDRSALAAVQPRSVGTEGDEVGQRRRKHWSSVMDAPMTSMANEETPLRGHDPP